MEHWWNAADGKTNMEHWWNVTDGKTEIWNIGGGMILMGKQKYGTSVE